MMMIIIIIMIIMLLLLLLQSPMPSLPTNIIPTKIARLKLSRSFPMDLAWEFHPLTLRLRLSQTL